MNFFHVRCNWTLKKQNEWLLLETHPLVKKASLEPQHNGVKSHMKSHLNCHKLYNLRCPMAFFSNYKKKIKQILSKKSCWVKKYASMTFKVTGYCQLVRCSLICGTKIFDNSFSNNFSLFQLIKNTFYKL